MQVLRAVLLVLTFSLVAASSSSESVFTLTFENSVEDMSKVKTLVEHTAKITTRPEEYTSMQVLILDANHLEVSYLQGKPGCSGTPNVDGAVSAMETTIKSIEAEYGPVHIDQQHRANHGEWQYK